jgi:hypothetical protein
MAKDKKTKKPPKKKSSPKRIERFGDSNLDYMTIYDEKGIPIEPTK